MKNTESETIQNLQEQLKNLEPQGLSVLQMAKKMGVHHKIIYDLYKRRAVEPGMFSYETEGLPFTELKTTK